MSDEPKVYTDEEVKLERLKSRLLGLCDSARVDEAELSTLRASLAERDRQLVVLREALAVFMAPIAVELEQCESKGAHYHEFWSKHVESAQAALSSTSSAAERVERSRWIAVSERLPEMKEVYRGGPKKARVLIFNGHYVDSGSLEETYAKRKLTWKNSFDRCANVTHWQPLPDPPALDRPDGKEEGNG